MKFQRANGEQAHPSSTTTINHVCISEYYAASKETVALAEERFMSNSHEWQFDNAWQEMLNHATIKVMEAETQKTESGLEHQRRALIFNTAEQKVQQLEEKLKRYIIKSRPYFEENQICQDQLKTQKGRIAELQQQIQLAKKRYSTALRSLENISEDIHRQRGDLPVPQGPREPGVGAELSSPMTEENVLENELRFPDSPDPKRFSKVSSSECNTSIVSESEPPSGCQSESEEDGEVEEDASIGFDENGVQVKDEITEPGVDDEALESLRQKVKVLAIRPVEGGEGRQQEQSTWEDELNATVNKLDHLMMIRELNLKCASSTSAPTTPQNSSSRMVASRSPLPPIKMLKGGGQLPATNTSLNELSVTQLMPYVLPFPHSGTTPTTSEFGAAGSSVAPMTMTSIITSSGGGVGGAASTKDQKRKLSI